MRTSGTVLALAAALALAGCQEREDPAPATITRTVTQDAPEPVVDTGPSDPELCAQIEAQKSINQRLYRDGYADSYAAEYDQLLRANGC